MSSERCAKHNGGEAQCRVIAHFPTMPDAIAWARESAGVEGTRFLVRFDSGRYAYDPEHSWEAIQSWLKIL